MKKIIETLVILASKRNWINSNDADASVFEWLHGADSEIDAGENMSTE
jgi:hypothetical protein